MKIRMDFVTNSSSSSFVISTIQSDTLSKLLEKHCVDEDEFVDTMNPEEDEIAAIMEENAAFTIAKAYFLLSNVIEDYSYFDVLEDSEDISQFKGYIEEALEQDEFEPDDVNRLKFILDVIANEKAINNDITCSISSGCAISDSGGPDFYLTELDITNGHGHLYEIHEYDGYYGEDNETLRTWCEEHGYFDKNTAETPRMQGYYAEDMYFDPPFDEMIETGYKGMSVVVI